MDKKSINAKTTEYKEYIEYLGPGVSDWKLGHISTYVLNIP